MPTGKLVTLALPCFNPTQEQWSRLCTYLFDERLRQINLKEILVIDDGSTEWLAPPIELKKESRLRILRLPSNRGKGGALRMAVQEASAESSIFAFIDFDLPYAFEDLIGVIHALEAGVDICIADRATHFVTAQADRVSRSLGHKIFKLICRIGLTGGLFDTQAGLKAYKLVPLREISRLSAIDSFIFDVEWLYIAMRHRLAIRCWPTRVLETHASGKMRSMRYGRLFVDLSRIVLRILSRRYDSKALVDFIKNQQDDLKRAASTAPNS